MQRLNQDILFDIGKKLVEDGDSEAVIRFALSGKEPLKEMKKLFSSVTHLELHFNHYVIGWGGKSSTFTFNKTHFYCFMEYLGISVKHLLMNVFITCYQPIIDNIVARKKLDTLILVPEFFCHSKFMADFLASISPFIKNITIPNRLMDQSFRDTVELQSLKITNFVDSRAILFCCKTRSLEFSNNGSNGFRFLLSQLQEMEKASVIINSNMLSIKHLIISDSIFALSSLQIGNVMDNFMKFFTMLETLKFNCPLYFTLKEYPTFLNNNRLSLSTSSLASISKIITQATKVPSKIIISFHNSRATSILPNLVHCKGICSGFEYDETISDFYCFRKDIQSAGTQLCTFEIQAPKLFLR